MSKKSGIIRFNCTNRKRQHRGVERNFDPVAMASVVNSPEVQERVKHRDMIGYYGHWPRVRFGLNPAEGGIVDGKQISLEPAIVTTHLRAYDDGTIEHEAEFAETSSGKLAARLHQSKLGGFSSAVQFRRVGEKAVPYAFFGFDYVYEPNFSGNRTYDLALDSTNPQSESHIALDEVGTYYGALDSLNSMLDQMQAAYDTQAQTLETLRLREAELMSMLATGRSGPVVLDGLHVECIGDPNPPLLRAAEFLSDDLVLPGFEEAPKTKEQTANDREVSRFLKRRFGS